MVYLEMPALQTSKTCGTIPRERMLGPCASVTGRFELTTGIRAEPAQTLGAMAGFANRGSYGGVAFGYGVPARA
ncbi:MAG: hypothetical protein AMXMBFR82_31220 [Candidatus Hydrogenedentota bacterium]